MLIRRAEEMDGVPMQMDGAEGVTMRMMVGRDDDAPTFAMRHFTVEPGGHSPRHHHDYEHEVYVVAGSARLEHDGEFHDLKPGDALFVQPNVTHQFVNTGNVPFKFLCFVPITFDCGKPTPGS